jgi:bifunctional non-homologous end joining protein LigD
MEKEQPNLYVTKMTKAIRTGKIYLDYLRNDREATSIAPFSPRARRGAPVAMTLDWKELEQPVRPEFHVTDFGKWESRLRRDPWKRMAGLRQQLSVDAASAAGESSRRAARR